MENIDEFFEIATLGEKTIDFVKVVSENKSAILTSKEELIKVIGDMEDMLYVGIKHWGHYRNCLLIELQTTNEVQFTDTDLVELFINSMKYDTTQEVSVEVDLRVAKLRGDLLIDFYNSVGVLV